MTRSSNQEGRVETRTTYEVANDSSPIPSTSFSPVEDGDRLLEALRDQAAINYVYLGRYSLSPEEARRVAGEVLGEEHVIVVTDDSWHVEHSVTCRLRGEMSSCYSCGLAQMMFDDGFRGRTTSQESPAPWAEPEPSIPLDSWGVPIKVDPTTPPGTVLIVNLAVEPPPVTEQDLTEWTKILNDAADEAAVPEASPATQEIPARFGKVVVLMENGCYVVRIVTIFGEIVLDEVTGRAVMRETLEESFDLLLTAARDRLRVAQQQVERASEQVAVISAERATVKRGLLSRRLREAAEYVRRASGVEDDQEPGSHVQDLLEAPGGPWGDGGARK